MKIVLTFVLLLCLASTSIVNYGTYTNTIPSYTYPFTLNAGDTIVANLYWPSSADLDIYFYKQGQDLLSRSVWLAREYSATNDPEILTYTISTPGVYYVRADLYSSTPVAYTFTIKINNALNATYYDTVLAYTTARTVQQFITQNACKVQITYTGPVYNVYVFAPGVDVVSGTPYASDTSTNNPKVITVNLNAAGNWSFVINHGITSGATTLTGFNLDIKTFT